MSHPASTFRNWIYLFRLGCVVAFAAALIYFYQRGDLNHEALKQAGAALPMWLFIPAWLTLPLAGFPISIVLLATGMKFSPGMAIAITVVGMAFHTFVAWHIAHGFLRQRIHALLRSIHFGLPAIPDKHQIWFTAVYVTVPGLPYAVKLYSLALTDLPFRRYMLIVWIFHVLNSIPFVGLGAAAANFSPVWLIVFGVLAVITIALTKWLKQQFLTQEDQRSQSSSSA